MTNKISKEVIMKTQFKEYYSLEGSFLDFIVNFKRVALGSSIGHTYNGRLQFENCNCFSFLVSRMGH